MTAATLAAEKAGGKVAQRVGAMEWRSVASMAAWMVGPRVVERAFLRAELRAVASASSRAG